MIVAEITKDHLYETDDSGTFANAVGRQFDSEALRNWWGWGMAEGYPADTYFMLAESNGGRTTFKLYDDDGELYYSGWLINDDECVVQQFVLAWAQSDSGCTTIKVHKADPVGGGSYVQEIG